MKAVVIVLWMLQYQAEAGSFARFSYFMDATCAGTEYKRQFQSGGSVIRGDLHCQKVTITGITNPMKMTFECPTNRLGGNAVAKIYTGGDDTGCDAVDLTYNANGFLSGEHNNQQACHQIGTLNGSPIYAKLTCIEAASITFSYWTKYSSCTDSACTTMTKFDPCPSTTFSADTPKVNAYSKLALDACAWEYPVASGGGFDASGSVTASMTTELTQPDSYNPTLAVGTGQFNVTTYSDANCCTGGTVTTVPLGCTADGNGNYGKGQTTFHDPNGVNKPADRRGFQCTQSDQYPQGPVETGSCVHPVIASTHSSTGQLRCSPPPSPPAPASDPVPAPPATPAAPAPTPGSGANSTSNGTTAAPKSSTSGAVSQVPQMPAFVFLTLLLCTWREMY